jgi:hypothetical protein
MLICELDEIAYVLNLRGGDIPYNPVFFAYLIIINTGSRASEFEAVLYSEKGDEIQKILDTDREMSEKSGCDRLFPETLRMKKYSEIEAGLKMVIEDAAPYQGTGKQVAALLPEAAREDVLKEMEKRSLSISANKYSGLGSSSSMDGGGGLSSSNKRSGGIPGLINSATAKIMEAQHNSAAGTSPNDNFNANSAGNSPKQGDINNNDNNSPSHGRKSTGMRSRSRSRSASSKSMRNKKSDSSPNSKRNNKSPSGKNNRSSPGSPMRRNSQGGASSSHTQNAVSTSAPDTKAAKSVPLGPLFWCKDAPIKLMDILQTTPCHVTDADGVPQKTLPRLEASAPPIALQKSIKNECELQGMIDSHIRDGVAKTKWLMWLEDAVNGKTKKQGIPKWFDSPDDAGKNAGGKNGKDQNAGGAADGKNQSKNPPTFSNGFARISDVLEGNANNNSNVSSPAEDHADYYADPRPTEVEAAEKLEEFRAQQNLFVGLSFATISGTGPNGAIIHYHPHRVPDKPGGYDGTPKIDPK